MARKLLPLWRQTSPVRAPGRDCVPRTPIPWSRLFRPAVELLEDRTPPSDILGGPLLASLGSDSVPFSTAPAGAPATSSQPPSAGNIIIQPVLTTPSGSGSNSTPSSSPSGNSPAPGSGDGGPTPSQDGGGGGIVSSATTVGANGGGAAFGSNDVITASALDSTLFVLPGMPGLPAVPPRPHAHGHAHPHHAPAHPHPAAHGHHHPAHHGGHARRHGHHRPPPALLPPIFLGTPAPLPATSSSQAPSRQARVGLFRLPPASGGGRAVAAPAAVAPTTANGISPLEATVGPVVDASRETGNQAEEAVASNPLNPNQVFIEANEADILGAGGAGVSISFSTDGGQTFHTRITGNGSDGLPLSAGDPSVTWDKFGNLYLSYIDSSLGAVDIMMSTDGGATFRQIASVPGTGAAPSIDQPTIVTGPGPAGRGGSLWVSFNDFGGTGQLVATGAPVLGPGQVGSFMPLFLVPNSSAGNFGDIAIGPLGQVMVAFQHDDSNTGPDTISVSLKPDGLGPGGFSNPIVATGTNIGGFTPILAQPDRSIDAEAGLAWDRSGGAHNGRVYLVYTDAPSTAANSTTTDVFVRTSDDNGVTWSAPIQVNDQTGSLHFLPKIAIDQTSGNVGVGWYDTRNDSGQGSPNDRDGIANDEPEFYAAISSDGDCFQKNIQLTTQASSAIVNPDGTFDFGDYTGAWFDHGVFRPAWADNSAALGGNNPDPPNFEVATAAIRVPTVVATRDVFEPNETSDRARQLGTLTPGAAAALHNLTILNHADGLPDYDWFRWQAGAPGVFLAGMNVGRTTGSLELHVFRLDSSDTLTEVGTVSTGQTDDCTFDNVISVPVRRGESILVEVKGANSSLGVHDQGTYDLTVALV